MIVDVLLAAGEPHYLDSLEAILEAPAYRLHRAADAASALRFLDEWDVAAVVLDVKTAVGLELAELITGSERLRRTRIVYVPNPVSTDVLQERVAMFADLFRKKRPTPRTFSSSLDSLRAGLEALEGAADRPKAMDGTLAMMSRELERVATLIDELQKTSRSSGPADEARRKSGFSAAVARRSLRVLLIEDDDDAASVTALLLKQDNHDVRIARDGAEAMLLIRADKPDVVLVKPIEPSRVRALLLEIATARVGDVEEPHVA